MLTLGAALAMTGGVAATTGTGDAAASREQTCSGWTAYAPLETKEPTGAILGFLHICTGGLQVPPEGWPPGAQWPDGHPEIQVIR